MLPDLTSMLQMFMGVFKSGRGALLVDALTILKYLAALTLTWSGLMWALGEGEVLKEFLKKVIFIGAFVYLVTSFSTLVPVVVDGFIYAGTKAGGSTNTVLMSDPSAIIGQGLIVVDPIFQSVQQYSGAKALLHLPTLLTTWVCGLLVLLAYIVLAAQVFITYCEFGLISTLTLVLIPFGVWKPTSFIAEKAIGSIISFGVKLMVLSFVVSVGYPIMEKFAVPPDPTYNDLFTLLAATLVLVGLALHAPGVASGMLSGAPSLSFHTAAGTGLAVAAGAAGGGIAAHAGLAKAAQAGVAATKAAAQGMGAASMASELHGGGVAGAVRGAASLVGNTAAAQVRGAKTTLADSFSQGAARVFSASGGAVHRDGDGGGSATTPASGGEAQPPTWAKRLQTVVAAKTTAQAVIPPESSPSGGVTAPIKHDS